LSEEMTWVSSGNLPRGGSIKHILRGGAFPRGLNFIPVSVIKTLSKYPPS